MSKLILFEDCPDWFEQDEQDLLVALTPQACYLLSRRHKKYHVVSEFGSESELARVEDCYWEEQLAWFDQFDDLLWQELPKLRETGIRPACLYGYFLKVCLDNLFIRGLEIAALLRRGHRQVVLWRREASEPSLDATLFFRGPSVYSRLLPIFCRKFHVDYEERVIPASDIRQSQQQEVSVRGFTVPKRLLYGLKGVLLSLQQFGGAAFRSVTFTRQGHSIKQRRLTLLFLKTSYDMGHLMRSARKSGHRCLLKDGNELVDVTNFFRNTIAKLPHGLSNDKVFEVNLACSEWTKVADIIGADEQVLWKWPDAWYDIPMSKVLVSRLKYWITSVLPVLMSQAHEWVRIYADEGVDFVITPTLWDLADFSAIAASQMTDSTERVHIEHGDSPLALKTWDLLNLFHFDHYFAPHHEVGKYFRERRTCYDRSNAKVHVGSYRWHINATLSRRPRIYLERSGHSVRLNMGSPPNKIPCSRPIVIYLVTLTRWDTRYLNSACYPDSWYYQLQTRIVDSFVGKDHYTFVVKLFPGDTKFSHPFADYVRNLAARNIHVSQVPFVQWLPWADRVIMDFPSTGLYEAAVAGIPFHLLLHENLKVRAAALEKLRPWTTVFTDPEEAVKAIDAFLRANVTREPVMHPEGDDILTTLESIAAEKDKVPSKTIEFS